MTVSINYMYILPHLKPIHEMICRVEIVSLFPKYEVIKPLPMYDCIVHGTVTTVPEDNLLNPLDVLKCEWASRWV